MNTAKIHSEKKALSHMRQRFLAISRGSMDRFVGAVPEGGPL